LPALSISVSHCQLTQRLLGKVSQNFLRLTTAGRNAKIIAERAKAKLTPPPIELGETPVKLKVA
jgi:hypothetical protein